MRVQTVSSCVCVIVISLFFKDASLTLNSHLLVLNSIHFLFFIFTQLGKLLEGRHEHDALATAQTCI